MMHSAPSVMAPAPLPHPSGGPVHLDTQVKSVLISWPEATTRACSRHRRAA
jgi:hypothetical protein